MKEKLLRYGVGLSLAALVLMPALAAAQTLPPDPLQGRPEGAITVLCRIAGWMFSFLIVITILFVIAAAFQYMNAGGDPEKVKGATNILIYAAVAIAVALVARGFPLLITNIIGGASITGCV